MVSSLFSETRFAESTLQSDIRRSAQKTLENRYISGNNKKLKKPPRKVIMKLKKIEEIEIFKEIAENSIDFPNEDWGKIDFGLGISSDVLISVAHKLRRTSKDFRILGYQMLQSVKNDIVKSSE